MEFIKKNREKLIFSALPLAVGSLSALLSGNMKINPAFNIPPLMPPQWLFPIMWTLLYILMGYGSYLVYKSDGRGKTAALFTYAMQLSANFLWSILFFRFELLFAAFSDAVLLWVLAIVMIWFFSDISRKAAILQIPYILWLTFAAYLSFGFWALS